MLAEMETPTWYSYGLPERCRILADTGFVRDEHRIWRHPDGRAIGEGVMTALIDTAFFRFLGVDVAHDSGRKRKREVSRIKRRRKSTKSE